MVILDNGDEKTAPADLWPEITLGKINIIDEVKSSW